MSGFRHILFPVDFSDRCHQVRPFVKALAQQFDSKITLMHVVQIPTGWYGGVDGGYPILFDLPAMEDSARQELDGFFETPAEKIVKAGDPATEITKFAEQNSVDLIMMPTHGYGKFRSLLLGSVTAKVLHDAKCPVWTATHTDNPELPKHLAAKSIMGAIDATPESLNLIKKYAGLANAFQATLRLVHALPDSSVDLRYGLDPQFRRFLAKSVRDDVARMQSEAGTSFEVCMEEGSVSKIVREAALHHDADLIVIGRGTLRETFGPLRTNSYAIIRDAPCPVLSD